MLPRLGHQYFAHLIKGGSIPVIFRRQGFGAR
jgi:hypothetical protein